MKKRIIMGAAIAASYILLCRFTRGYWNLSGDTVVIIMAAISYLCIKKGLQDDRKGEIDGQADEPLYIRAAKVSGGISGGKRIG